MLHSLFKLNSFIVKLQVVAVGKELVIKKSN